MDQSNKPENADEPNETTIPQPTPQQVQQGTQLIQRIVTSLQDHDTKIKNLAGQLEVAGKALDLANDRYSFLLDQVKDLRDRLK